MKLITEYCNTLNYITEGQGSNKTYALEGIFMQSNVVNRNNRFYPKETLLNAVNKYMAEQVNTGRAVGELNHPPSPMINLDKVSHRITNLKFEGDNVVGKAVVLNTPMGQIVNGLLDGGVKLGVSSRGMGTVEKKGSHMIVKEDYVLSTVDIVQDPSAQDAFVNGIMEGVEWIWDNGLLKPQQLENYETKIRNAARRNRAAIEEAVWKDFLSKL